MTIQAYPFLVSRNRSLDYRTVVAPAFFINEGISSLLARAAGGNLTFPGHAICREIQGTQIGDFTLVFHVVEANRKDIYPDEEDEVLTDPFGREISLIEGIVLKGRPDKSVVTQEAFDLIHESLLNSYRSFWEDANLFEAPVVSVNHLDLDSNFQLGKALKLDEVEPFISQRKPSKQLAIAESETSDINNSLSLESLEVQYVLDFLKTLLSKRTTFFLIGGVLGVILLIFLISKLFKLIFR